MRHARQPKLFDLEHTLPNGLVYRPDFLTKDEEEVLLAYIQNAPLEHPVYKDEYRAKRRHMNYGWSFNFRANKLVPGPELPPFLHGVQRKIAKWLQISPGRVAEALINEYPAGSGIGWHVDTEAFETIVGISLGSWANMRFRPLATNTESISLEVEPRSAYIMQKEVRWQWQHSVAPVRELRYSITFRTLPLHIFEAAK